MSFKFGKTSRARLNQSHPKLQGLAEGVIKMFDFSVVTGHRDEATQNKLYPTYSKVQWPNSMHNRLPSLAIDIAPYHAFYGRLTGHPDQISKIAHAEGISKEQANGFIREEYAFLAGIVKAVAFSQGIKIRWGGDWDGDNDFLDNKFDDLMHFELRETT